jgi:HAD superfamily hydrolase (TIGR01509 family)
MGKGRGNLPRAPKVRDPLNQPSNSEVRSGVIFDIDGTLVDSNYQHSFAWWRALKEHGRLVPMFEIHRRIGMGGDNLLEDLIGSYSQELSERRKRYFRPLREELTAFDGAADLLRAVSHRGAKVVLATSASKEDLDALLAVLDADDAIDHITSVADVDNSKPDPDVFQRALDIAELVPERAIVLGDTPWDIEAAEKVGLKCVCVESGGWSRRDLESAGAVGVFHDPRELLDRLDQSPLAPFLAGATAAG